VSDRGDPQGAQTRLGSVQPRAHGAAVLSAKIRMAPEDFVVEELDAFSASGSGEHLLLTIEKRGMNTAFAAKQIAAWAGIAEIVRHATGRDQLQARIDIGAIPLHVAQGQSEAVAGERATG
jgi:hypothetical protein